MEDKLQLRVQRYGWDAAVPYYQAGWAKQLRQAQETLLDMAGLHPGMRVLETACGDGMVTFPVAKAVGQTGHVLATDLSGEMVAEGARLARLGGISNVTFARMGAEALDATDDTFDLALCALGLMYVPDPLKALAEMRRVVRPGGRVVATIWGERRNCGWADVFPIVDAHVISAVCPMFFASGARGMFMSDFEKAGLVDTQERRETQVLHFDGASTLIDAVLLGGPVALAVKRFDKTTFNEVADAFLDSVSEFRSESGQYDIPGEFVTVSGLVSCRAT